MLTFDNATYVSLLFKFILSLWLSNSLSGLNVPLFLEFRYRVSVVIYNFIEFIILLYTSVSLYNKNMVWLISFSKYPNVLPTFTGASAIGNLWRICSEVNILIPLPFCCLGLRIC